MNHGGFKMPDLEHNLLCMQIKRLKRYLGEEEITREEFLINGLNEILGTAEEERIDSVAFNSKDMVYNQISEYIQDSNFNIRPYEELYEKIMKFYERELKKRAEEEKVKSLEEEAKKTKYKKPLSKILENAIFLF